MEDLWAFNEESVARAVFECTVPVISAVGHETDTTIIDYVADLRAPTPSAAAELAVYDYREVKDRIQGARDRMRRTILQKVRMQRDRAKQTELKLRLAHPRQKLNEKRQYAADLENHLRALMENRLSREKNRMALMAEKMKGLSPLEKLGQGYSFVRGKDGKNIRSILQAEKGDRLAIYVTDGVIRAEAVSCETIDYPAEKTPDET